MEGGALGTSRGLYSL